MRGYRYGHLSWICNRNSKPYSTASRARATRLVSDIGFLPPKPPTAGTVHARELPHSSRTSTTTTSATNLRLSCILPIHINGPGPLTLVSVWPSRHPHIRHDALHPPHSIHSTAGHTHREHARRSHDQQSGIYGSSSPLPSPLLPFQSSQS